MEESKVEWMDDRPLEHATITMLGAFDYSYPREKSLRVGLEGAGATVHDCLYGQSTVFPGVRKLVMLPYIYVKLYREVAQVRAREGEIDLLVVTKFNPLVLPLAWFLARRLGAPLVYDLFVSLHRTAEMRDVAWPMVKVTYLVERLTYSLPDYILVCTDQFAELYAEMYRIPLDKFVRIPPGADEDRFYPRDVKPRDSFTALYWGNFLPHHGADVIVEAAADLENQAAIEFVFLGTGPCLESVRTRARNLELSNVSFEGFVPEDELHRWIATSHVCLGVFSDDPRALASITNKVCESVASRKATVTERSPATVQFFEHGEDAYLVAPQDHTALAGAIQNLSEDPELVERLEAEGFEVHCREFSSDRIAYLLGKAFQSVVIPDT